MDLKLNVFIMCILICHSVTDKGVAGQSQSEYYSQWPANKAAVAGQADGVLFPCLNKEFSAIADWHRTLHGTTERLYIARDGAVFSPYQNEYAASGTKNHSIIVKSVSVSSAQNLECALAPASRISRAYLLILDSEPSCTHNISSSSVVVEGDYVSMSCSVSWSGLWGPTMQWTDTESEVLQAVDESSANSVQFSVYLRVIENHHGKGFRCKTYYSTPADGLIPDDTALFFYSRAAPSWEWTNNLRGLTLNVETVPKDLTITEEKPVYSVGEIIQCTARGNPAPSILWQKEQNGTFVDTTSDGKLPVTTEMEGDNTYRCVASNKLGTIDKPISFEVIISLPVTQWTSPDSPQMPTTSAETICACPTTVNECMSVGAQVGIGVAVTVVVMIALLIVFYVGVQFGRKRAKEDTEGKAPRQSTDIDPVVYQNNSMRLKETELSNEGVVYEDITITTEEKDTVIQETVTAGKPTSYDDVNQYQALGPHNVANQHVATNQYDELHSS